MAGSVSDTEHQRGLPEPQSTHPWRTQDILWLSVRSLLATGHHDAFPSLRCRSRRELPAGRPWCRRTEPLVSPKCPRRTWLLPIPRSTRREWTKRAWCQEVLTACVRAPSITTESHCGRNVVSGTGSGYFWSGSTNRESMKVTGSGGIVTVRVPGDERRDRPG